jgi:hypothetical protein
MDEHPGVRWLLGQRDELREYSNNWVALTGEGPVRTVSGNVLTRREIDDLISELTAFRIDLSEVAFHLVDHPTWGTL